MVGVVLLAGCLGDGASSADRPSEEPTAIEYDSTQFGVTLSVPDWSPPNYSSPGHVEVFGSNDAATDALDFEIVNDDRLEEVEAFIEETEFETEFLLEIVSVGPDTSYREVAIEEVDLKDGIVVGTAVARSVEDLGGDEPSYPSALVRVTPEGGWPKRVEITIVDGWDRKRTVEVRP